MSLATGLYFLYHLFTSVYQYLNVAMFLITSCKRYTPAWSQAALIYSSCSGYITSVVQALSNSLFDVTNGGFTALRAYAIGGRSILLASVCIVSSLLTCAFNIYDTFAPHDIVAVPRPVGCVISPTKRVDVFRIMIIMGEAFALVCNVLLVAATWRHASIIKIANGAHVKTPVTSALLRDGTLYFV
ncbi:hypothetical protein DAEQUDRAFT_734029 [Daedalea quercina L-15889]|uniref:Uncharacterized protein n=1 Tax=Daedalea quercina L-15889 TaxID=1314783 RepID=A0A165KKX2_9APHY|nr:hypothetical protein DAEQUDRAFT_734029 [Daedalea quercina L-15889]